MVSLANERNVLTNSVGVQTKDYVGLSTDTKPTENVPNGSTFFEMDTSTAYMFNEDSSAWVKL